MKKIVSALAFVLLFMIASPVVAQFKFGLKGGLNITEMSLSSNIAKSSNHSGWFIGPTVKITVPIIGFGIDASALYDQRDTKIEGISCTQKNLNVPINLRYTVGMSSLASIYFAAGPQFGFNLGHKWYDISSQDVNDYELKKSNFSVNVGAGIMLLNHLEIGANYNLVCGKTGDVSIENTVDQIIKKSNRTNAWQISATYYF